jgi:hypothetical protein
MKGRLVPLLPLERDDFLRPADEAALLVAE